MSLIEKNQYLARLLPDRSKFTHQTTERIEVRKELLKSLKIEENSCAFFLVDGESMKPTIEGECEILIDRRDIGLKDGKIYLFSIANQTFIRRVQLLLDRIVLIADNPDYSNMEIIGKDLEFVKVVGRVRYIGRRLP